jgi:hypothetical protein
MGLCLSAFPAIFSQWLLLKDTTPNYSGGTAPAFNRIPFTNRSIFNFQKSPKNNLVNIIMNQV